MRSMRVVLAAVTALVVFSATVPAAATDKPDVVSGGNSLQDALVAPNWIPNAFRPYYASLFGSAKDAPWGKVVADSGFRPFPNGFSFANNGSTLEENQWIYGQPTPWVKGQKPFDYVTLDSAAMRATFGDGVCLPGQDLTSRPGCRLTRAATEVARFANDWGGNGKCLGFAFAAQALYNGDISPASMKTGLVNTMTTLNPAAMRTILRLFITQYFYNEEDLREIPSMRELIDTLTRDLQPGSTPYVIGVLSKFGGHALSPFAVLDQGDGKYDIAVYDNNWPNQMRAIHVDTVANTYTYEGSTDPSVSSMLWDSGNPDDPARIVLLSVKRALEEQECIFCAGPDQGTIVSFSPVRAENAETQTQLTDLQGSPLDESLYREIAPEPPADSPFVSLPLYVVDRGIPFKVEFSGKEVKRSQKFAIRLMHSGSVREVLINDLNAKTTGVVEVSNVRPEVSLSASSVAPVKLRQTIEYGDDSFAFTAWQTNEVHAHANMRVDNKRRQVIYSETHGHAAIWDVHATRDSHRDRGSFHAHDIAVGEGDQLVLSYASWTNTSNRPTLWLDKGSDGTLDVQVPMTQMKDESAS